MCVVTSDSLLELLRLTKKNLLLIRSQIQSTKCYYNNEPFHDMLFLFSDIKLQKDLEEFKDLTLKDFTYIGTLGMGGFGRVELVCAHIN